MSKLPEFKKDVITLLKKYRTLHDDLTVVKQVLEVVPDERPPFSFRIDNQDIKTCIIKVKKNACKALKGRGVNSGLRLIYANFPADQNITFIELYHKNDKESEDKKRITDHFTWLNCRQQDNRFHFRVTNVHGTILTPNCY